MQEIESLLTEIAQSAKYRHISPNVVRRIAMREWQSAKSSKEAIKQTKTALHQVTGAYHAHRFHSRPALKELETVRDLDSVDLWRTACLRLLSNHASTAERLPFLEAFYSQIFALVPPPVRILDLGCGLNPLAIPFMHLPKQVEYLAADMDTEMMGFLTDFFRLSGVEGEGFVCDLLTPSDVEALCTKPLDLVFLFKVLPLLDQWDKSAGKNLLRSLPAKHIVVTYPTRSLGGKGKGMAQNYTTRFESLVLGEPWHITTLEFPNELCFVIAK